MPTADAVFVNKDNVEDAVLQFIQAFRLLGNTRVNTYSIAGALDLDHRTVLRAISNLSDKGVKPLHGREDRGDRVGGRGRTGARP